jgi:hypothetical protein
LGVRCEAEEQGADLAAGQGKRPLLPPQLRWPEQLDLEVTLHVPPVPFFRFD